MAEQESFSRNRHSETTTTINNEAQRLNITVTVQPQSEPRASYHPPTTAPTATSASEPCRCLNKNSNESTPLVRKRATWQDVAKSLIVIPCLPCVPCVPLICACEAAGLCQLDTEDVETTENRRGERQANMVTTTITTTASHAGLGRAHPASVRTEGPVTLVHEDRDQDKEWDVVRDHDGCCVRDSAGYEVVAQEPPPYDFNES